jgi:hypothetical protein
MKSRVIRGLGLLLSLAIAAPGADVSSVGNWTETIDANDLIAGAGSNVTSQYESVTGSTTHDIVNTAGGSWRIVARRADSTWHGNLILFVRRTSDGSGPGSILGGTSYVQLSALDTEIFTGTGDRSIIAVQFKLTGMSKDISPNTYSSGIIFTITAQ